MMTALSKHVYARLSTSVSLGEARNEDTALNGANETTNQLVIPFRCYLWGSCLKLYEVSSLRVCLTASKVAMAWA